MFGGNLGSLLYGDVSVRKTEQFFLLSITRSYVVSVRSGFLFRLELRIGCVISIVALPVPIINTTCYPKTNINPNAVHKLRYG